MNTNYINISGRWIGICVVAIGIGLFIIAHMIEPYMDSLSGTVLYAVAVLTGITIAVPISVCIVLGAALAAGLITIKIAAVE